MQEKACSLREKKHARTKVGLMNAFMDRLKDSRFDDISIREVCREMEVAEGTFFNYFPEKIDVIGYYIQLLTQKIVWQAAQGMPEKKSIPLINRVFSLLAKELDNINVIYQVLAVLLVQSTKPRKLLISGLEKKLAFPDYEGYSGAEKSPSVHVDEFFDEAVRGAVKSGELPPKTKINDAVVSLMTILVGTLAAVKFRDMEDRGYHYKRQLQALWRDLGAGGQDKGGRS